MKVEKKVRKRKMKTVKPSYEIYLTPDCGVEIQKKH